jgi:hypothetical protein
LGVLRIYLKELPQSTTDENEIIKRTGRLNDIVEYIANYKNSDFKDDKNGWNLNGMSFDELEQKYGKDVEVYEIACPNWVGIVEGVSKVNADDDIKTLVDEMLTHNPEKIVLGCTHYPYLLDKLEKYAPRNLFIDPAGLFTVFVKEDLKRRELFNPSK